jgi:hypothetical protein
VRRTISGILGASPPGRRIASVSRTATSAENYGSGAAVEADVRSGRPM